MARFFEKSIHFRLKEGEKQRILAIIRQKNEEKYYNLSHFVRCAVIKLIKEEEKNEKK